VVPMQMSPVHSEILDDMSLGYFLNFTIFYI
jgi:hypothetical protein